MTEVDADELRRVTVCRDRVDRKADAGPAQQEGEPCRQQDRRAQRREPDVWDDDAAELKPLTRIRGRDGAKVRTEDQEQDVDDDEVHPECQEEGEKQRGANDPVDHAALQRVAQHEQGHGVDGQGEEGIEAESGEELPGDVAADDHQRSVREVDDVEHTPHQAEPHAHRDVDASGQQAENDQLDEGGQTYCLVAISVGPMQGSGTGAWRPRRCRGRRCGGRRSGSVPPPSACRC